MVDDTGLPAVRTDTSERLYRVLCAAFRKCYMAIFSILSLAGFTEFIPKAQETATVE
ncbi:hypothetical protein [Arthrobacter sp. H35-D1]|uniref:hypothetical protein n=1 Tax=Arthrobacter sp. H35-D1 TaxID=3046202 RepID=UPI0024B9FB49|nr:hypothetical protein [Arthrobacter sp. H35-D1]MDJ0315550.1 hypothetical protein [Arthrobacter sp. H35-D1]